MDIIGLEDLPRGTRQRLNAYYKKYPTYIRYGHGKREIDPDEDDELWQKEMDGRLENYKDERRENEEINARNV